MLRIKNIRKWLTYLCDPNKLAKVLGSNPTSLSWDKNFLTVNYKPIF